jgi:hypothetical protein
MLYRLLGYIFLERCHSSRSLFSAICCRGSGYANLWRIHPKTTMMLPKEGFSSRDRDGGKRLWQSGEPKLSNNSILSLSGYFPVLWPLDLLSHIETCTCETVFIKKKKKYKAQDIRICFHLHVDYVVVNRRLVGLIQDTREYTRVIIDVQVKCRVNKQKFWKGNYLLGSYDVHGSRMRICQCRRWMI